MKISKKLLSGLLCMSVLFSACPSTGFAEEIKAFPEEGLCEHHPKHDESCGYTEGIPGTPCKYECEICDALEEQLEKEADLLFSDVVETDQVYLYEEEPDKGGEPVESGDLLKDPDTLYLDYIFDINSGDIGRINTELSYTVPVPEGLKITGSGSEELKLEGTDTVFAELQWSEGKVSIRFNNNIHDFESINDCYFYFPCAFDKDSAKPCDDEENRYLLSFIDGSSIIVGLEDEEVTEVKATLKKEVSPDANDPEILNRKIIYTPYQNTEKTDFEIRDRLGEGLILLFLNDDGSGVNKDAVKFIEKTSGSMTLT